MVFEIDGRRFSTATGFYDEFSNVVIPGVAWGHNLDALDDLLAGGMGTPDDGFTLLWLHHELSAERLGYAETVRDLERRRPGVHPSSRLQFEERIARARAGVGPTLYDQLVETIRRHGHGGEYESSHVELELA